VIRVIGLLLGLELSRLLSHPCSLSFGFFPSSFLDALPLFLHVSSPADGGSFPVNNFFIEFQSSNLESESLFMAASCMAS
jgi:hypothetical protein